MIDKTTNDGHDTFIVGTEYVCHKLKELKTLEDVLKVLNALEISFDTSKVKKFNLHDVVEGSPQDPAICEYSGLRPVEGYKEMSDKELKEGVYKSIIDELDNREGETPEEKAYRMGWINGYEEGVYDGENK